MLLAFVEGTIQLVPDGSLLVHILLILVMIAALNTTVFKPINKILNERDNLTKGRSRDAQSILRKVEQEMSRYESALREARVEGYRLLEQERSKAMTFRQEKLNALRENLSNVLEEQKASIGVQSKNARVNLEGDVRKIAESISAQILGRYPQR